MSEAVEVPKEAKGSDLAAEAAKVLEKVTAGKKKAEPGSLRLICSGRVVDPAEGLLEQGVKPGWPVMAVAIDANSESLQIVSEQRAMLDTTKKDARLLAEDSGGGRGGGSGLSLTDQSGKTVVLPAEEERAIIVAMSLHEKGKAALDKRDFSLALVLLLEADEEYGQVRSALLEQVDNYGEENFITRWRNVSEYLVPTAICSHRLRPPEP